MMLHSWRTVMPSPWYEIGLALVAVLCGGIVGVEREKREKPAGMRTLILVTLGATVFTMTSFIFNTATGDSGRVVAQIVTGIGFLGAGVIMRGRGIISGATTAATIWMSAAIGVVVGAGYAVAAFGLAVLVRMILTGVYYLELHTLNKIKPLPLVVEFEPDNGKARIRIERILVDFHIRPAHIEWAPPSPEGKIDRVMLRLQMPKHHLFEMLGEIVEDSSVKSVRGVVPALKEAGPPPQVF